MKGTSLVVFGAAELLAELAYNEGDLIWEFYEGRKQSGKHSKYSAYHGKTEMMNTE